MSLFGSSTIGADNKRLLLTIRAGRMYKATSTDNLIHPDTRSGILSFTMEASGVIDMKWEALAGDTKASSEQKDLNGNSLPASESTVVMPGGAKFERVTKCTTGRVFVIDFDTRQMFYWLQEQPDKERDESYFRAIKNAIEGKTRQGAAASSGAAGGRSSTGASATTNASAASNNAGGGVQLSALQNILTNLGGTQPAAGTSTTTDAAAPTTNANPANNAAALSSMMAQMQQARGPNVTLQQVIRSQPSQEALRADPAFYMSRLFDQLPPGTDPSSDVIESVQNPQFSGAASVLDAALADPNGYREIMSAFGLQAPQGVAPSTWGLLQAVLNEKPDEKNKTSDDAAPSSNEGTANAGDKKKDGGNNDDAASS